MTLQEIQYKAQGIIHKWRDDDSAPYIEFVEELAHMTVPEPSEDLEEAAKAHRSTANYGGDINLAMEDSYKKGAKWQKEQMMKEAVEGDYTLEDGRIEIEGDPLPCLNPILILPFPKFKPGQKVKLIIEKED